MNSKKLMRLILVLSSISLFIYLTIYLLQYMNKHNWLPFGFHYSLVKINETETGKVSKLTDKVCKKQIINQIADIKEVKSIIFNTIVYSHNRKKTRFFLAAPAQATLFCNGIPVKSNQKLLLGRVRRVFLNKGFNDITIKYWIKKKGVPKKFIFFLKFSGKQGIASRPIPFYYYVLPDSTFSRNLFSAIRFLDNTKSLGFLLALVLILLYLPRVFFKLKKSMVSLSEKTTLGFLIFEYLFFNLALMFSIIYLNNRLHLKLSGTLILVISLLLALINLINSLRKKISKTLNFEKILVFILIGIFVFGYLYAISGKIFPIKPLGSGDLYRHLEMVDHYTHTNEVRTDRHWSIYPQSLHVFISMLSGYLGTQPVKLITPFLSLILVMVYFLVFLLIKHFFPEIGPVPFFIVLISANVGFVFNITIKFYNITPAVSILFFLSALFFFYEDRLTVSSFLFAVSLIVYPFYIIMFSLPFFFLFINRLQRISESIFQKLIRFFRFFSLPLFFIAIYLFIFINEGFKQQGEGFSTYFLLNPFSSLKPLNTLAILVGIGLLLSNIEKNRKVLILIFGSSIGFLVYYIPYGLFNAISTYYIMKNILYFIFIGIILETYALHRLYLWLKQKKWSKIR